MMMTEDTASLHRSIDCSVLGERLRRARLAAGLTQAEVAEGLVSAAYISRIEGGHRRPDLRLLRAMTQRLGTSPEELLGVSHARRDQLQLALDYAELELASGESAAALAGAQKLLAETVDLDMPDIVRGARQVHALALEATGRLALAVDELEQILTDGGEAGARPRLQMALSRCYRESGDLASAVETAERALKELRDRGLAGSDEAVQIAVTLAAAQFERGETGRAIRGCRQAIAAAERTGSSQAKAAAYWNASVMESNQGDTTVALGFARRALAYLATGDDVRNLGRLRTQLGILQLRVDPPEIDDALSNLTAARRELEWASASPADKADNELAQARAAFLVGDTAEAAAQARRVHDLAGAELPFLSADAKVLEGQIAAHAGNVEATLQSFEAAAARLTEVGSDRRAAQLWVDMGDILDAFGHQEQAAFAYRRAAASAGLRVGQRDHRPGPAGQEPEQVTTFLRN